MADQEKKGDGFEKMAEKKLTGWGLFGSKHEDAADLFEKAANCFKIAKNWNRAASAYMKLANCQLKAESKYEASSAFAEAGNCYKKISLPDAAQAYNQAVNLLLELGRLTMAARYTKEIGDAYQQDQSLEKAVEYFERAADLFDSEGQTSQSNTMKQKVAEISAQLEQYQKASEIFEAIARFSINNNLLKYSVRGILLNAGICQLCRRDDVAVMNSLERYQEIDPTFSGTREYRLLSDLAAAMEQGDSDKFTSALQEYDSMTRLDAWKTTLLLRAKNDVKKSEIEDEDLT